MALADRLAVSSLAALLALVAGCAAGGGRAAANAAPAVPAHAASHVHARSTDHDADDDVATGMASYYSDDHEGRRTASGRRYDAERLTAAHRTLPFGTRLRVTNLANDRSVVVTVTDRGPFVRGRIVDVSRRAAEKLGFVARGT